MIQAFITAFFSVFLAYIGRREKNHSYFLLLSFVILTLFLSLGYYWGNDVVTYENWFEGFEKSSVSWWNFSQYDSFTQKEYGFIFVNLLFKPLGFWGMRAALFVIENAIIYSFIVKHVERRWYWLAVFIYVFNTNFWVLSSSMMRQWLAMCIVVLAVDFLLKKKYLLFTLFLVFAISIHFSAAVCLFIIPLLIFRKKASKVSIYIYGFFLALYYLLLPFVSDYIILYLKTEELYTDYLYEQDSMGISNVLFMLIYTIIMYYAVKTKQKDFFLAIIVMLFGLILPLPSLGELSARLGYYFTVFTIGTIPMFMNNTGINKNIRTWTIAFVCLYYIYMFVLFFQSPTWIKSYGTYQTIIGKL